MLLCFKSGMVARRGVIRWVRRHPLFALALGLVVVLVAASWSPWVAYLLVALAGCVVGSIGNWKWAGFVMACGGWAVAYSTWQERALETATRRLCEAPAAWVNARVIEDGRGNDSYWSALAELRGGDFSGQRVWWQGKGELPVVGAQVKAWGMFSRIEEPRNPGEFDRAAWMRRQGVRVVFKQGWKPAEIVTGKFARWGAGIRDGFRRRLTEGIDEPSMEAQVIRAVVMGERPSDADEVIEAFRQSGSLHVFSVSGLHVSMVGAMAWVLLSGVGVPRRWAVAGLLPVIFGYAWVTGGSAPAERSAWMAAVFLGAFVFRRKPDLLNALGFSLLVGLLLDVRIIFQPGVQLSYGVVAAIAVGVPQVRKWFSGITAEDNYVPRRLISRWHALGMRLKRWLVGSLSVSLAAGIGAAPLTAYHFGWMTPVSILAALVLVPWVFLLLGCALLSVMFSLVLPPVSHGLNRVNGWIADVSVVMAEGFAAIPGGNWQVGIESEPLLVVYDFGNGDAAACFTAGTDAAVLIDCGGRQSFSYRLMPSLRQLGLRPDSVVLSHPDGGHVGGGVAVWDQLPIHQAVMPVARSRSAAYRAWMDQAVLAGVELHPVQSMAEIPFPGGAVLEVLHAPDADAVNGVADDRVAVFRLHWNDWKILFYGDAGSRVDAALLESGVDLKADVMICGKHRSDISLGDALLDAVNPRVIVASNARFPRAERLEPRTVDYWRSRGVRVIDQADSGGVSFRIDEQGGLVIDGYVNGEQVILKAD